MTDPLSAQYIIPQEEEKEKRKKLLFTKKLKIRAFSGPAGLYRAERLRIFPYDYSA